MNPQSARGIRVPEDAPLASCTTRSSENVGSDERAGDGPGWTNHKYIRRTYSIDRSNGNLMKIRTELTKKQIARLKCGLDAIDVLAPPPLPNDQAPPVKML